jgi:hypothetical protein
MINMDPVEEYYGSLPTVFKGPYTEKVGDVTIEIDEHEMSANKPVSIKIGGSWMSFIMKVSRELKAGDKPYDFYQELIDELEYEIDKAHQKYSYL